MSLCPGCVAELVESFGVRENANGEVMFSEQRWRKASHSAQDNCVEIAHTLDRVRDSKQRTGPELVVGRSALLALLAAVRAGRFDG